MPIKGRSLALLPLLAGTVTLATFGLVNAQNPAPGYRPSLGDLMTMTVQPRHIKLGLAGRERNWTYAAYELHELEEAFERAASEWPMHHQSKIAELMVATTKEPMEAVAAAIKAADGPKFTEAYGRLTATCNACHQSTGHNVIVIQVPASHPFLIKTFGRPNPDRKGDIAGTSSHVCFVLESDHRFAAS